MVFTQNIPLLLHPDAEQKLSTYHTAVYRATCMAWNEHLWHY